MPAIAVIEEPFGLIHRDHPAICADDGGQIGGCKSRPATDVEDRLSGPEPGPLPKSERIFRPHPVLKT